MSKLTKPVKTKYFFVSYVFTDGRSPYGFGNITIKENGPYLSLEGTADLIKQGLDGLDPQVVILSWQQITKNQAIGK